MTGPNFDNALAGPLPAADTKLTDTKRNLDAALANSQSPAFADHRLPATATKTIRQTMEGHKIDSLTDNISHLTVPGHNLNLAHPNTVHNITQHAKGGPTLIGLPQELQTKIWGHALVTERLECVNILQIPSILQVSGQTRSVAMPLYWTQNSFILVSNNYEAKLALSWFKFLKETIWPQIFVLTGRDHQHPIYLSIGGAPNWNNLLQWVDAVRHKEIPWVDNATVLAMVTRPTQRPIDCVFYVMKALTDTPLALRQDIFDSYASNLRSLLVMSVDARWAN